MIPARDVTTIDPQAWLPPVAPLQMRRQVLESGSRLLPPALPRLVDA